MASRHCPRFLSLSAAIACVIVGGQGFLTAAPTCRRSSAGSARWRRSASGSEVAHPLTSPGAVSLLALSSKQVDAPGQWSPVRDPGKGGSGRGGDHDEQEEDFNINLGRALDYLATDVPLMFSAAPRLEIFTSEVRLKVPDRCALELSICYLRVLFSPMHPAGASSVS